LFFGHSEYGDLSHYLSGYYDTTIGSKRESKSYSAIALDSGFTSSNILFLSDVVEELDAARETGVQTCLVIRPGNRDTAENGHQKCISFDEITFSDVKADDLL
jgi:enolase-phosphatase E1